MTSSEVFTSLFWIVAGAYVIYLGWTCHQLIVYRSARRRHPSSRNSPSRNPRLAHDSSQAQLQSSRTLPED